MPVTLYDDQDNPVEGVLTPEEVQQLTEKATKADELEASIKEKEAELEKFRSKDMNFTKFREKTEEEKAKIMEKATEKEKMILKEVDDLVKEREADRKTKLDGIKERILAQEAGDDADLRKSIELRAKEWGEPKTVEEAAKRYLDAAILVKAAKPDVAPLNTYFPAGSYNEPQRPKEFMETDKGKAFYAKMFPDSDVAKALKEVKKTA